MIYIKYFKLNKIKEENLDPNKILKLEDLFVIIKTKDKEIDISKWILIKLNEKATENIWNFANKAIPSKGRYDAWKNLAKITNQNISNLKHKNERKRAKPLLTFVLLINFLKKYSNKYNFEWLERNTISARFKKSPRKINLPKNWEELGVGKTNPLQIKIPLIKWDALNKNPLRRFYLKDFIKRIEFPNPYYYSKRKKHIPFKKIGINYQIDFTKKVYIHLNKNAHEELFNEFLKNREGVNKKIKIKNASKVLGYYAIKTLNELTRNQKKSKGMPLYIILKIINLIKNKKYNITWVQNNLSGISSGERTYHKIKFPIEWQTIEGMKLLTSLIGDGGLGFRSSMNAWAVPHYAQFRHKNLLNLYKKAVKNTFGLGIKKQERIELPAVCGYIIVASGYFTPGHKSFTNPLLPLKSYKPDLFTTCLNWLISDDGCFHQNGFIISSGYYYTNKEPLDYMKKIREIINVKFPDINTHFSFEDKTCNLNIRGKLSSVIKLRILFEKYNNSLFATKKEKAFKNYLYSHFYDLEEYIKRYDKNGDRTILEKYWT